MRKDKKVSRRVAVPPKRGKKALEGTDKLLETLLDHTHMMIAYLDQKFNFVRVNRAYAKADERDPSFFPGKNHFDLYPNAENERIFRRVVETGESYFASAKPFEYAEHPERGVSYWDWSLIPIKGTSGAVTGLVLILVNVTERYRAEEALKSAHGQLEIRVKERTEELTEANRELQAQVTERKRAEEKVKTSEDKYKTLVETSNDMIFTVDLKGNFLFTNQAFRRLLGYSTEEIKRTNGFELVHPEDLEIVKAQFALLVEGKSVGNMEYRYKTRDGSYINILNNASPIFDPKGNVVAALGAARDITRRKQAEKALQESELWMRNMFNSLEEAVLVVTPDRALVNINEAAKRMFGYAKDELVDLSTEVLHVDHKHYVEFGKRIKEAFDKEEAASFEFEVKRKNGEIFPSEHTVTLLKNDMGESLGIVSVVRDVSERKRAEEELKQYREHLEELVEERTAELRRANEQLEQEITERKRAEEALKAEKEFTERALDAQTDTFFVFEPSTGKAVRWNKAFNKISGYSDEEIRSMKAPDSYYNEEDLKRAAAAAEKIFNEGIATVELSLITKDGRSIPTEYTGSAIRDDEGNPKYIIAVGRDVTERRQAEKALRESEEKFRNLAEQSPNMIFINKRGRVVYANEKSEDIMGYKREEFYSPDFDFLTLIAPEYGDLVKANFSRHMMGEEAAPLEYALMTKEGRRIEAILTSKLINYEGEAAIQGIVTDITDRKRAEEALQKGTYDLGERVKELNCLYGIADLVQKPGISLERILKGTVDLMPPAFQYPEITCARVVLEGRTFTSKNFRETIWRQASDIIERDHPVGTLEVYYLEEKPERDEGPFLAEERSLINAIAERLARITERKKGEQEIQELNKSLKFRAAELADANKELEAFSYSVSHDLRAPLRAIDGFSQALMEDCTNRLDEQGKDYLRRVRGAAEHMRQLIEDLLNLSLVMRKEMRHEETNLTELARLITAELQKAEPARQVEFVIQEGVLAHGDPRLLREVLENLLSNAWKFTAKHAQAKIEFGAIPKEEQTVYFVRDDGAGFDVAYIDKLFVPFQRLHSTAEFLGNGVGLAVVSRIINRHGGRIWAEGEVQKGAIFYFTL